jgi:hypothetical protein
MIEDERAAVERQIGRPPRALRRVVVRCPFGQPAVTLQSPYDCDGRPFPTTYYLTCRYLVAAVSRVEAAAGVERWTRTAENDPGLGASLQQATTRQRALRRELAATDGADPDDPSLDLGIGGAAKPERLKCLHAHVAFALAEPGYMLGDRILDEIHPLWPDRCCSTGE